MLPLFLFRFCRPPLGSTKRIHHCSKGVPNISYVLSSHISLWYLSPVQSKFSHLAALLSQNIKFAVAPFQYRVDCDDLWIQTDAKGNFDEVCQEIGNIMSPRPPS